MNQILAERYKRLFCDYVCEGNNPSGFIKHLCDNDWAPSVDSIAKIESWIEGFKTPDEAKCDLTKYTNVKEHYLDRFRVVLLAELQRLGFEIGAQFTKPVVAIVSVAGKSENMPDVDTIYMELHPFREELSKYMYITKFVLKPLKKPGSNYTVKLKFSAIPKFK